MAKTSIKSSEKIQKKKVNQSKVPKKQKQQKTTKKSKADLVEDNVVTPDINLVNNEQNMAQTAKKYREVPEVLDFSKLSFEDQMNSLFTSLPVNPKEQVKKVNDSTVADADMPKVEKTAKKKVIKVA